MWPTKLLFSVFGGLTLVGPKKKSQLIPTSPQLEPQNRLQLSQNWSRPWSWLQTGVWFSCWSWLQTGVPAHSGLATPGRSGPEYTWNQFFYYFLLISLFKVGLAEWSKAPNLRFGLFVGSNPTFNKYFFGWIDFWFVESIEINSFQIRMALIPFPWRT